MGLSCNDKEGTGATAQVRLPAHRRAGEDLRDDPVQIVKEGRPLPQDAAAMIPDGCEDEHWEPQSQPRSRGGNTSYVYGSLLLLSYQ